MSNNLKAFLLSLGGFTRSLGLRAADVVGGAQVGGAQLAGEPLFQHQLEVPHRQGSVPVGTSIYPLCKRSNSYLSGLGD